MIEVTQKLMEQKQEQQKEETELQKEPQQPNADETLPSRMGEPPKNPKEKTQEHLLK